MKSCHQGVLRWPSLKSDGTSQVATSRCLKVVLRFLALFPAISSRLWRGSQEAAAPGCHGEHLQQSDSCHCENNFKNAILRVSFRVQMSQPLRYGLPGLRIMVRSVLVVEVDQLVIACREFVSSEGVPR
jgi:hypothetical protein